MLFAHGAREPSWAGPFRAIRDRVARSRPDLAVELAYLELMSPSLEECIAQLAASGHQHVTIAPLFLGMGGHLKHDLPRLVDAIRRQQPALEIATLPPVGEMETLHEAVAGLLVNALPR